MIKRFDELLPGDVVYLPRWKELVIIQRIGNLEHDARFVDQDCRVLLLMSNHPMVCVVAHRPNHESIDYCKICQIRPIEWAETYCQKCWESYCAQNFWGICIGGFLND